MSKSRPNVRLSVVLISAAALVVALASCSSGTDSSAPVAKAAPRTITVSATGKASGAPDNMQVDLGIETSGDSAAFVLADNNKRAQNLLDQLEKQGVEKKDVQTSSVSLSPKYDRNGKIEGYAASNMVHVTLRDLDKAGKTLDTVLSEAGNAARLQGVYLGFNDEDAIMTKARVDAVKRARTQAGEIVEAAGAKLGKVRTITDSMSQPVMPYPSAASDEAMGTSASRVPIAAGERELNVQVRIVFELR